MSMAHRRCSGRRHYDSNSSDTELSEAEESRKSCIKRSKWVCFDYYIRHGSFWCPFSAAYRTVGFDSDAVVLMFFKYIRQQPLISSK